MNTCPVYRRASGLSYGATYSGPIGVILDPRVNLEKYREPPFHSSLCGSCSQVCPVQINIADQIYKWRREVAEKGLLKLSKKVSMSAIGAGPEISVEALEKTLAIPERSGDIKFRSVAR